MIDIQKYMERQLKREWNSAMLHRLEEDRITFNEWLEKEGLVEEKPWSMVNQEAEILFKKLSKVPSAMRGESPKEGDIRKKLRPLDNKMQKSSFVGREEEVAYRTQSFHKGKWEDL
jgi:hypothetical protein